jgi:outer membrane protease
MSNLISGNWKDMAEIYIKNCVEGDASQQWVAMADGRIALGASNMSKYKWLQRNQS